MKIFKWLVLGGFLACGTAHGALIAVTQNANTPPGLVNYSSATAFPTPHQAGGPDARTYFEADENIRAAIQIQLGSIDASDFDNPSFDSAPGDDKELLWQVGWFNPAGLLEFVDSLVLCWGDPVAEGCDPGALNVKQLVDDANASPSNPQALALATGGGILGALGGSFEAGTWEVRTYFDALDVNDFFDRAEFRVPLLPTWLLLLPGLLWLRTRLSKTH